MYKSIGSCLLIAGLNNAVGLFFWGWVSAEGKSWTWTILCLQLGGNSLGRRFFPFQHDCTRVLHKWVDESGLEEYYSPTQAVTSTQMNTFNMIQRGECGPGPTSASDLTNAPLNNERPKIPPNILQNLENSLTRSSKCNMSVAQYFCPHNMLSK